MAKKHFPTEADMLLALAEREGLDDEHVLSEARSTPVNIEGRAADVVDLDGEEYIIYADEYTEAMPE